MKINDFYGQLDDEVKRAVDEAIGIAYEMGRRSATYSVLTGTVVGSLMMVLVYAATSYIDLYTENKKLVQKAKSVTEATDSE